MDRFWAKTEVQGDCLVWSAAKRGNGYGAFKFNGKTESAHRVAFYLSRGRWPKYFACHTCHNRLCVNPNHLYDGTRSENMLDAVKNGSWQNNLPVLYGEESSSSKLTANDVVRIRELANSHTYREIANMYDMSFTTIGQIVRKENWAHL